MTCRQRGGRRGGFFVALTITAVCAAWPGNTQATTDTVPVLRNSLDKSVQVQRVVATNNASSRVPEAFRTASRREVEAEIARLRATLQRTNAAAQRRDLEALIEAMEERLAEGVSLDDLLKESAARTAQLRGLRLTSPLRYDQISRSRLRDAVAGALDEWVTPEKFQHSEAILQLFGALEPKHSLRKLIVDALTEQSTGYFDEATGVLLITADLDRESVGSRVILSHQVCRAVVDQAFPNAKLGAGGITNSDQALARLAVAQGDASMLMQEMSKQLLRSTDLMPLLSDMLAEGRSFRRTPFFVRQNLTFPFVEGLQFMTRVTVAKPEYRDRVFADPPLSTEQILHPEKYLAPDRDDPTTLTLPDISSSLATGWTRKHSGMFGEFQIRTLFETHRQWDAADRVGTGWDGDAFDWYTRGGQSLLVWASVWDTEEDRREYAEGIERLLSDRVLRRALGDYSRREENQRVVVTSNNRSGPFIRIATAPSGALVQIGTDQNMLNDLTLADRELRPVIESPPVK